MTRILFRLCIGLGNERISLEDVSEYGYSDEEWLALTLKEREALIDEWVTKWAGNYIRHSGAEIV